MKKIALKIFVLIFWLLCIAAYETQYRSPCTMTQPAHAASTLVSK